ncbi:MAG: hypothetical protein ACLU8D_09885 [Enterocloster sp.]
MMATGDCIPFWAENGTEKKQQLCGMDQANQRIPMAEYDKLATSFNRCILTRTSGSVWQNAG